MVETTLMISDDGPLKLPFSLGHRQNWPHDPDYRDASPSRVRRGRYRKRLLESSTGERQRVPFFQVTQNG